MNPYPKGLILYDNYIQELLFKFITSLSILFFSAILLRIDKALSLFWPYRNLGDSTKYDKNTPQIREGKAHRERIRILELEELIIGMAIRLRINSPTPCQITIAMLPISQNFLSTYATSYLTIRTAMGIEEPEWVNNSPKPMRIRK